MLCILYAAPVAAAAASNASASAGARGGSRILCKGGPELCARVSGCAKFGFLINIDE